MASQHARTLVYPLVLLLAGIAASAGADPAATIHPDRWPAMQDHVLATPDIDRRIGDLLGRMSLEDKIGQMVQADIASITPADLATYRLGSILAGGLDAPGGDIHAPAKAWLDLVQAYKRASATTGGTHAPIPILFGIDAVHGHAKIPGATIFPHNVGLGAAHDPELIRRIGEATAQEVAATGMDWVFAPTVAVVRDARWGRAYESYSDDPSLVAAYAASMVTGLQGRLGTEQAFSAQHVLATAKHFLGDGGTTNGRDQADNAASEDVLRQVDAAGYRAALQAGVGSVMASYNSWQGKKMHASTDLLTGILKQRWNFDGLIVGDWNAQEEIPGCTKFACAAAVNTGLDMIMAPDSWKQIYESLLTQARAGTIPQQRIDDAVARILRVKLLAGLLDPVSRRADASIDLTVLGSPAHRALAREAVRKSLVLLKNQGVLPIDPHARVLVAGDAADDIGQQCGGWTLDWQGAHNGDADILGATSIFGGIRAAVERAGGYASFSPDGSFAQRPDVAVIVYGEHPYAEFEGDRENLLLGDSDRTRTIIQRLRDQGIPVVTVLLSGRPLWVSREINLSQAYIAAWLPGSEGAGLADMLFRGQDGSVPVFSGRLSFPWPETAMPVTYDSQYRVTGAVFPRGYGLDLAHLTQTARLPEQPRLAPGWDTQGSFFAAGHVVAPWSIYVSDRLAEVRLTRAEQNSPDNSVVASVDGAGANGAAAAQWTGHGQGVWRIGGRPIDLSAPAAAGRGLRIAYRLSRMPAGLQLGMRCGPQCGAWLDATRVFRPGGWQTLDMPLSCFAARGADLHHVDVPFALQAEGAGELEIGGVSLTDGPLRGGC